jgi:glycosyltransferase involved in cell wall biosynthesis
MFDSTDHQFGNRLSARGIVLRLTTQQAISTDVERGRFEPYKIAVLVPCYNEEAAVAKVVEDFRAALPAAEIFVFDNNSTDDNRSVAGAAGAVVFLETHRGKGFVVRRMFSDVEADVYVLVDGDATYDASSVRLMV